jgi:hypothetical protein
LGLVGGYLEADQSSVRAQVWETVDKLEKLTGSTTRPPPVKVLIAGLRQAVPIALRAAFITAAAGLLGWIAAHVEAFGISSDLAAVVSGAVSAACAVVLSQALPERPTLVAGPVVRPEAARRLLRRNMKVDTFVNMLTTLCSEGQTTVVGPDEVTRWIHQLDPTATFAFGAAADPVGEEPQNYLAAVITRLAIGLTVLSLELRAPAPDRDQLAALSREVAEARLQFLTYERVSQQHGQSPGQHM